MLSRKSKGVVMKRLVSLISIVLLLANCAPRPDQNRYVEGEVGVSRSVEFGTVLNKREVDITSKNSEVGELGGAVVGGGAGSYLGNGSGSVWTAAGGAIAGAVAGYYAEHALYDRKGYEYVVQMQSGEVKTIVQEQGEKDEIIKPHDHVMLQYCDAGDKSMKCSANSNGYQRLFKVSKLPPYVKKKRKYVQTDETGEYTNSKGVKGPDDFPESHPMRDDN